MIWIGKTEEGEGMEQRSSKMVEVTIAASQRALPAVLHLWPVLSESPERGRSRVFLKNKENLKSYPCSAEIREFSTDLNRFIEIEIRTLHAGASINIFC